MQNNDELSERFKLLEERFKALEAETYLLAEQNEESSLLGTISEEINASNDLDRIIDNALERLSLLKNIPFCASGVLSSNGEFHILHYYTSFTSEKSASNKIIFPESFTRSAFDGMAFTDEVLCTEFKISELFSPGLFVPLEIIAVPLRSQFGNGRMLLFADEDESGRLSRLGDLFLRLSDLISSKEENLFLLNELQRLNKELEQKVEIRTVQLARSEKFFRALFEQANDGIFFIDTKGKVVSVNESFARLHGYTTTEMLHLGIGGLDVKGTTNATERIRRIMDGESLTFEVEHYHKDGHIFPLEVTANLISTDNEQLIIAIHRDITERKRADDALKESELQLRTLFETMAQGIVYQNEDGKITKANPAAERILGLTLDQMQGLTSIDPRWNAIHEDGSDFPGDTHPAMIALRTGEKVNNVVMGVFHPETEQHIWININALPQFKPGETKPYQVYATFEDITERKKAEEALRLAQKMESIGTLAGGIAHDFNNLLNAIMGQSSLAMGKLPKESPAVSNITKAINASEHAADLTRQLLAYSGRGKFFSVEIDLNNLVRENVQMLQVSVPKSTQLQYELGTPSPHIIGDIGQIQQVIMNLIINAGEAMGSNPGYITVGTNRIELTENSTEYWKYTNTPLAAGSYALLQVKDTGSGISQETLARIFDPFFTTKFTGRGLGLAAVLGIIKGHKGGLRIESKVGKGTMFEIVLPLITTSTISDAAKKKDVSIIKGEGKTILIIDDDPFVFELLEDVLSEVHFTVIGATDPLKGIELYRREHQNISMVILDYSMPNMDGKTAFAELKKINTAVKVLLCSGYTEEETLSTFGTDRPTGFFQKPYKTDAFLERVLQII